VADYVTPFSGVGVMQRELYPRLEGMGIEVIRYLPRQPTSPGVIERTSKVFKGFFKPIPSQADVLLSLTTPFSLRASLPTVGIVHDLRWARTKSAIGHRYRAWDLKTTVRRSAVLATISERTANDIKAVFPDADPQVIYPGPGQLGFTSVEGWSDQTKGNDVLLIGLAPHKRNELAAQALGILREEWPGVVRGVNVSAKTKEILVAELGAERCEFHTNVSPQELARLYGVSKYTIQLSVEEGFGMPYIEALSAGCIVIAVDQPLTEELLGDAAVLLRDGGAESLAEQLRNLVAPSRERRAEQAARYSWDSFAEGIAQALEQAIHRHRR